MSEVTSGEWIGARIALLAETDTSPLLNTPTIVLLVVVLVLLSAAYIVGQQIRRKPHTGIDPALVQTLVSRVRWWWVMCVILAAAFLFPTHIPIIVLFGVISFWALREFITLTPTRLADHRTLFWVFFLFTPLQYVLVGLGDDYYGLYSVLIPVYGFLFIPARVAVSGDYKRFLERTAKIQAGLLICVYALSHAPALLSLQLLTRDGDGKPINWDGSNAGLLFYFVLLVQIGDILQYVWGRLIGKRVIAPGINATKTWEGFFGGVASTTLLGTVLWWVTPFNPWESACMAMVIAIMGAAGSMTMSAIKRDRGVKDFGTLVAGHVGILDRIDSICFAAPVFFQITRYYFTA